MSEQRFIAEKMNNAHEWFWSKPLMVLARLFGDAFQWQWNNLKHAFCQVLPSHCQVIKKSPTRAASLTKAQNIFNYFDYLLLNPGKSINIRSQDRTRSSDAAASIQTKSCLDTWSLYKIYGFRRAIAL